MDGTRDHSDSGGWLAPRARTVGLRAIPVVLILSMVGLTWPGNGDEHIAAVDTETTLGDEGGAPAGDERAVVRTDPIEAGPQERPRLFVQGTLANGEMADEDADALAIGVAVDDADQGSPGPDDTDGADSTDGAGSTGDRSAAGGSASGATTTSAAVRTSTTRRSATSGPTTTTRRTTTTQRTTTTRRTTTTQRTTTTRPPTTQPPTTAPPSGGSCSSGQQFERVFRDDFNGSSLSGRWSQYNSSGNSNFGLRRRSANSVSNGMLNITARMENGKLVSGGMALDIDMAYGKYVVRVRTDNDPSQAVSGVVLTWPQSGVHPRDGENNIYETLVKTPNRNPFFTFIHKPFGSKSDQEHYKHEADGAQFQIMTMEWSPNRITIKREGPGGASHQDVWTVNETSADLIPDVPHHLAIQLDAWKHSIGAPVRMQVDYVEVHRYCG